MPQDATASIAWSTGTLGNSTRIATAGNYQVSATNECGNTSKSFTVAIETPLPPLRFAISDTTSCLNGRFIPITLRAPSGFPNYHWNTNEITRSILIKKADVYTVSSENLCGEVSASIDIKGCKPDVYIPNAFSPNDDGNNDYFTLYATDAIKSVKSMKIFDRYGEFIFSKQNFQANIDAQGWDGTFRGQTAANDVYAYLIEVEYADGKTERFVGDVTLVK